jgi:hypothetical protein
VVRAIWCEVRHCHGGEESNQGLVRMGWVVVVYQLKCVCVALLVVVPNSMKNTCNALIPNIGARTVPKKNCLLNFTLICGAARCTIGWCFSCTDSMQCHPQYVSKDP